MQRSSREKAMGKMALAGMAVKDKADSKLGEGEKRNRRARFTIVIEKKNVDGKEVVSAKLERDSYDMYYPTIGPSNEKKQAEPPKPPLPKEYTDLKKFAEIISSSLTETADAILKTA